MYLAQLNTLQTQAPFYVNILESIINNVNDEGKKSIDIAINEAIHVANGTKDVFAINNNHYFFVTTLLSKYKDNLTALTEGNFTKKTYQEILNILK